MMGNNIINNQIVQILKHLHRGDGLNFVSNTGRHVLDGLVEFEEFLEGLDYRGVIYPINNTGYSMEKLCLELPICAESRKSAMWFDEYCSGNYNKCPCRVLNLK